jgi:prepilin-type N-terminal cleavage/methylation domain-containing protein
MRLLKSKKGLTLVEVIVTVFIAAIVFGMVASIVGFFSGFFGDETQQINRQENMRILILNMEKDIRTSDQMIDFSGDCYIIGLGDGTTTSHEYCFLNGEVTRDGVVIARNVATFTLTTTDGSRIIVDIRMIPDSRGIQVEASYTIYLRQAGA